LLIQHAGASESGGEFTVKRYSSRKVESAEGWRHERIRLEPLNPEFESWDLDPSDLDEGGPYRVRGEFLRVLPTRTCRGNQAAGDGAGTMIADIEPFEFGILQSAPYE